ncbi:hypothetical protein [Ferrovum myxofaciens]|uniref:hypothetical protein n=1 Tax=Ferrovum myxofaciens TaxID=416213 RepID=UPI00235275D1|nr:hypothetical protein [Ferrovum myxofaciens]MBU6994677.1 hypothetical protein [Ferrovum myxofaciens]
MDQRIACLLAEDADPRLHLDPYTGVNAYGIPPLPQDEVGEWGSATASALSQRSFQVLRQWWPTVAENPERRQIQETLAQELLQVMELDAVHYGANLYSSGSGALGEGGRHLLRQMKNPVLILCQGSETGSRVPEVLQNALGCTPAEVISLPVRAKSGDLIPAALRDELCWTQVIPWLKSGRQVLLVLTDGTKTGQVVPGVDGTREMVARYPGQLHVLVDACQLRIAWSRVKDYLDWDWPVAITGSKFIGGPPFSGALLYSRTCHKEFESKEQVLGVGVLLRWVAALTEMKRWHLVPKEGLGRYLARFQAALEQQVGRWPAVALESMPRLERSGDLELWDVHPTIFPFEVCGASGNPLERGALDALYRRLPQPGSGVRGRWGQPVRLGEGCGQGPERWALRLCLGARLLFPWLETLSDEGVTQALDQCLELLDRTVVEAARIGSKIG